MVPTNAVRDVNLASAARLKSGSMSALSHSPERVNPVKAQVRSKPEFIEYSVCY